MPTYTSEKAREGKSVRPIEVMLTLPENIMLLSGKQLQEIDNLEGRSNKAFANSVQGNDYHCHVEWVVKGFAGCEIEVTARGKSAGVVRTVITLK